MSPGDAARLARTYNPWDYPAAIRDLLLTPVREAGVSPPIRCSAPLVDAVFMAHGSGILIPLANYTAEPIPALALTVEVPRAVARVESARLGRLAFQQPSPRAVEFSLPLESSDFLKLLFR